MRDEEAMENTRNFCEYLATHKQYRLVEVEIYNCKECPHHETEDDTTFYCMDLEKDVLIKDIDEVTGFPHTCNACIKGTWE